MNSLTITSSLVLLFWGAIATASDAWLIDSQADWIDNTESTTGIEFKDGMAAPTETTGTLQSIIKRLETKRAAKLITFQQSPTWQNWTPIENVGPTNLRDAPVALSLGPNNYWMFGRYAAARPKATNRQNAKDPPAFQPEAAKLEGFDVPLVTTPFPNQFNAPGGLKKSLGGYHAWQSRDMINWVHHGPVTEGFSKWVTSAEHVGGKTYIYYDFPNDQDPHVYVDADLFDGVPGKNEGKALEDPSHGSDSGFIRDLNGKFHVIFEDWSHINASQRSWDSPVAGHAVSDSGTKDFKIVGNAVDVRTNPTGKMATYNHPHWRKEDPEHYSSSKGEYEIHEPNQQAFGDWAAIAIGGRYYLFGDYDPEHKKPMSVAWFTSPSIDEPFQFCGHIGTGHPDPDICFAEGKFYLVTQQKNDFTSPGPWVDGVETRVGVDTDNDGNIDQWSEWETVKESYDYIPGFAKQIAKTPAAMDLSGLPDGYGFQFEVKLTDTTENSSQPILDQITLSFDAG